jgi:PAS domain S-box-containing protein
MIFFKKRRKIFKDTDRIPKEALRESEEKYYTLVETIVEGILILNFKGIILFANRALAKMLGYDEPEGFIGKNAFDFVVDDYKKQLFEDLSRASKGEWGFLVTYKAHKKNGELLWVDARGRNMTYEGQNAELVVVRDITERRQMIEEIRRAKDELELKVKERTSELKKSLEKVERLLRQTVGSLSAAVEAKDPYTAGHQRRVAELACAITGEMGFSEEQIDGMYIAALVHDIGKIHIPAEILTRPGKLSKVEIDLINTHCQYGYDILRGIEFPWPIAEIVLQHHERIDGSGYPLGLRGDKILVEAKILAVADAVEATATNRPYKTSIGLERALKEISSKKGILYDPLVVAACLRLFTEKDFSFNKKKL